MYMQKWGVYMRVEIWLDLVCPYSYIGKKLFEKTLEDFSHREHVHITYRSYVLYEHSLRMEPSRIVDDLFVDWNGETREEKINHLYTCAQQFGLDENWFHEEQLINTLHAHRIIKYARKQNKEKQMVDRILQAHFFEEKSIDQLDCLQGLAVDVGLKEKEVYNVLHACKYTSDVRCDTDEAKELGAEHIPFIVINDTCGVPNLHTPEQLLYILEECWDETADRVMNKKYKQTTYCSADVCNQR